MSCCLLFTESGRLFILPALNNVNKESTSLDLGKGFERQRENKLCFTI